MGVRWLQVSTAAPPVLDRKKRENSLLSLIAVWEHHRPVAQFKIRESSKQEASLVQRLHSATLLTAGRYLGDEGQHSLFLFWGAETRCLYFLHQR